MKNQYFLLFFIIIVLMSCRGSNGLNSLIETTEESIGDNCIYGGLKIETGLDANDDGTLAADEVLETNYVCSDLIGDKQISFNLLNFNIGGWKEPEIVPSSLPFFDIRNYIGVDSVIFITPSFRTTNDTGKDVVGKGVLELYDLTNDEVIMNSKISSDDIPENTFLTSKNILEYIPKYPIKLGVRTYTEGDFFLSTGTPQLVLFRK